MSFAVVVAEALQKAGTPEQHGDNILEELVETLQDTAVRREVYDELLTHNWGDDASIADVHNMLDALIIVLRGGES